MLRTAVSPVAPFRLAASSALRLLSGAAKSGSAPAASAGSALSDTDVVVVDGCRTPFQLSSTGYKHLISQELGMHALRGLLAKTGMDPDMADYVVMGTVIQEVRTSNLARESALAAGFPLGVPAHTVSMACISSNQAVASGAAMIKSGQADVVVAGGTETMSDLPIRFSKKMRQAMIASMKVKHPSGYLKLLRKLSLKDLAPEAPGITEFSTGETMGKSSDRLAARWGVSRKEQDDYALRSHHMAAAAAEAGLFDDELTAVEGILSDNGIKGDSDAAKMASLKPAFVRPHGTHTAANSSFLTDGASAVLIMSGAKAAELGFTPKARIRAWNFVSQDPKDELLMGPAYATSKLLAAEGVAISDIDVFEFHEAFAGQILSNLNAMDSDQFARDSLGRDKKVGRPDMDKFNTLGGSLSIGHPFGATGGRLVTTASNRLQREDGKLALIAACAAGGQGHAMLLERL